MPRRAYNNRDDNEPGIIKAFAQCGVEWTQAGPLDGWVFILGHIPVEVKNPDGKNRFRPSQERYIAKCLLNRWPYLVVRTNEDVANAVNALRKSQR